MTKLAMILGLALAFSATSFADETAAPAANTEAPAAAAPAAPAKAGKKHMHKRGGKKAKKGASEAPKAE